MSTTSQAYPIAKQIADLAAPWLDGVECHVGFPGELNVTPEMLWVDDIAVESLVPVAKAGRRQRHETISITLQIRVTKRPDLAETHVRLSEIVARIEDFFADDPTLGFLPPLIVESQIDSHKQTAGWTPNGPVGFAEVVVGVESRLT